jgi:phage tail-like protein
VAVQRDNPYLNFNFLVDIGLGEDLGFSEVELPSGEIAVIEYREGGDRVNSPRKLPGLAKYPNVTLKRGITGRTDLFEWWKTVRDGQVMRRNVTITLLDEQRQPVLRWLLRNAWPVKIEAGSLNAVGNEVAIESLELAHEGLELE